MLSNRITPMEMSKEEFREAGYFLIDHIADFISTIKDRPVTTAESPAKLQALLGNASLPETGVSAQVILNRAAALVTDHSLLNGHPKFFGYITSSPTPIGALADLLSAAVNANVGANILSPMATEIEKQTIRWLAEFIGVSPDYGGIMVSGGNMANFTAFVAARTAITKCTIKNGDPQPGTKYHIVYCSKATHTWIEKAAFFFGSGSNDIRWIEQDDTHKIRIDLLEEAIRIDIQNGNTPMMVIGNAGDVSTGVVDDLKSLGVMCKKYSIWFHVDGAYGVPAAVIPEFKPLFDGLEMADSIAIDPHKWLYSPIEAGCTLVKNPATLLNTYSTHPVYYNFDDPETHTHNFHEYGFQNSRGFRALKVWAALQQAGRKGYIKMIGDDIELSRLFFRLANNHPELEAVTQNLSIATLRYTPAGLNTIENPEDYLNTLNQALLNSLQRGGLVFLSNAVVKGKYCLRGCIVNFRTTEQDIKEVVEIIVQEGQKIHKKLMSNH